MKKPFLALCFLVIASAGVFAQSGVNLVFDQSGFGNKFSVLVTSDSDYDYYAADITKLPARFEKIYFLNLVYNEQKIFSIDADITKDQLWFKAYKTYKENEITCLFDDLKSKTIEADKSFTDDQKADWLAKYDKFQKK
jgi:hypothetical protein